jgi:2-polyprenyl-3-methyl-5-hydroxy-6-metoxy-1,4-benzoquinol methylase
LRKYLGRLARFLGLRPRGSGRSSNDQQRDKLSQLYWSFHPRFQFFKTLPRDARFLDIGAGSGALLLWREHFEPARADIRMFAIDLAMGEHFAGYEASQIGDVEEQGIRFDGAFDAAIASHIIEHLKDPKGFLGMVFARLAPGGRIYLETPAPQSKDLPKTSEMAARGVPVMISSFFDDASHVETIELRTLIDWARAAGFAIETAGTVRVPFMEDPLMQYAADNADAEMGLYGYWSATQWAQYLILRRPYHPSDIPPRLQNLTGPGWRDVDILN